MKAMRKILPNNVKPQVVFTGRKLSTSFQIKNKTEVKHKINKKRIDERIIDHVGRSSKSDIYKHSIEIGHRYPDTNYFKIIGGKFHRNLFKR